MDVPQYHFYPRSPCGERPIKGEPAPPVVSISIHALLAESDLRNSCRSFLISYFYPRSPCGERPGRAETVKTSIGFLSTLSLRRATSSWLPYFQMEQGFLSTLSLRRATCASPFSIFWICHFYPRSPCGERPDDLGDRLANYCISIHALLAESDVVLVAVVVCVVISIHALLAESDANPRQNQHRKKHFYPRSPCGERLGRLLVAVRLMVFLSTLSLRRATK